MVTARLAFWLPPPPPVVPCGTPLQPARPIMETIRTIPNAALHFINHPKWMCPLESANDGTTLIDCNATFEGDGAAKGLDVFNY
jgi:hypothetical protein